MAGNHNSGRKPKYMTIEHFETWLGNHWRHMTWKVNALIAGFIIVIGLLVTILYATLNFMLQVG